MSKTVGFIHTVSGIVDNFKKLSAEFLPGVETFHIADDSLIRAILKAGGLTPAIAQRVADHVVSAGKEGADVIQFTCSSISPCAADTKRLVAVPVLQIDAPMAEQ